VREEDFLAANPNKKEGRCIGGIKPVNPGGGVLNLQSAAELNFDV